MKEIGVGLLGFGTVGAGVVEALQRNGDLIASRSGVRVALRRVADLDLERDRGVQVDRRILTSDARAVVDDPSIDVVIELIGGVGIAKELAVRALRAGKPVVTANKKMLAECGRELFALAVEKNADLGFEASVGGGIPIVRALREGLVANRITEICGILNGTCNYILTRMESERLPFESVLQEAQAAGYAEAEPSLDIDGLDTAHKAVVLASLAYGFAVPMESVYVEGIRRIGPEDIRYAGDLGYRIKLLAIVKQLDGRVSVRVHPALVPVQHMLASVDGVFNAVLVRGDIVGDTLYYGRGAGRLPTASAVLSDLADVAWRLAHGHGMKPPNLGGAAAPAMAAMGDLWTRYYLRFTLMDKAGVLGRVAQVLGRHGISIASAIQKEIREDAYVPVVFITHRAQERNVCEALREIDAQDVVGAPTVPLRIEDLGQAAAG
jgi:homoserine dehydrogenase